MSHQVLARKWRPRALTDMIGQEALCQALSYALDQSILHHAYLFTGTRGIGKTTVARILAKCLNCEVGISHAACDQCKACLAANQGNFADLIEIDAASKTKVEDTRELLDNVPYLPSQGRFKIYLIDEVHMLSGHSFNALLKTLEEPPQHVKFILATTETHKLPSTILSRCIQFHLKPYAPAIIHQQLAKILQAEAIKYEAQALDAIALAGQGSLRDAIGLCEQAIVYGQGQVLLSSTEILLGHSPKSSVMRVLHALLDQDFDSILALSLEFEKNHVDYAWVLAELLSKLHHLGLHLWSKGSLALDEDFELGNLSWTQLIDDLSPELLQIYYQTALLGRQDLPLAPCPRIGFEMTLLRMLSFQSLSPSLQLTDQASQQVKPHKQAKPQAKNNVQSIHETQSEATKTAALPAKQIEPRTQDEPRQAPRLSIKPSANTQKKPALSLETWPEVLGQLSLSALVKQLADHCVFVSQEGNNLNFALDQCHKPMLSSRQHKMLEQALSKYYAESILLKIELQAELQQENPAQVHSRLTDEANQETLDQVLQDGSVKHLMESYQAKVIKIVPNDKNTPEE